MKGGVKSFSKYSKAEFKSIGTVFKGTFAANMMSRGITSMLGVARRGVGTVLEEYIDFDKQIGTAAAKFPDKIKRGTEEFEELGAAARTIGAETEHTSAQAAKGLAEYAKAGIDSAQAMSLLAATGQLATSAEVEFATAASMSLDALNIFGLKTKDTVETTKNLLDVNDVLATVVSSAKLEFEDFNDTLQYTGPIANLAGASMRDVAAVTGLTAMAGIRGTKAGTALKNMYIHLAKKTPAASKALKGLNIEMVDGKGDIRDALDILVEFSTATEGMGSAQRLATTELVFGLRGMQAVAPIMAMNSEEISEYRDNVNAAKDANTEMSDAMRLSLGSKIKTLQSALIETGFEIIEAFAGEGSEGLDGMIESIRKYDPKPIIDGLRDVIDLGKTMFRLVRDNWETVKSLAKWFVAIKVAVGAVKFAQWGVGLAGAMTGIGGAIKQTSALGGNLNRINTVTGAKGGALYTPAAKGTATPKGGHAPGVGKAGAAMGAISAVIVGWTVGTAISTKLDEVGMGISGQQAASENMLNRIADQLSGFTGKKMGMNEAEVAIRQMSTSLRTAKEDANSWKTPFNTMAAVFAGAETPLENYLKKQKRINELYAMMQTQMGFTAEDIRKLGEAAQAGQNIANVNVNVEGPGAGDVSTTTKTSGPSAPKVDVKKSGQEVFA